ncbi:ABC transporter permease [Haloarchaeobius salinus]|uniref:ABC transporter permease n=1 Tax=Haloarchaeobius salinus TaxID=1198298 RepID=UPI00210B0BDA|nr:ABC transporter permease [Haloarchaeobius salinus]
MASRTESERGPDWLAVATVLGALLLCYYLVPVLSLLASQSPGTVLSRLDDPAVVGATTTSVATSAVSTAIGATFGLPLAYWLARTEGRVETLLTALVVLPLVLPPIVSGMVLLTVVGPNTLVGSLAAAGGLPLTRSFAGVVLAQTFVASPFIVVTAKAAFEGVDDQLEAASRSLGKSRATTVRRVTLPLAWPGVVAGVTLAFARAIGEFGATIMLAYYPRTMPVQIWVSFSTAGLSEAFPVAVVLLAVAVVSLVVLNLLGTNPLD